MNMVRGLLALSFAVPALAMAERIDIRRDTVLEVVADHDLSVRNTREGDRFSATVRDDRDLPRGTQLRGEIVRIQERRGNEPASMDLEFRDLVLPDGTRQSIHALPIALDNRNVRRDREGRMYADSKKVRNEYHVFGGMLGGLVIGALIKKPFEGAFIGTLAGILIGEAERQSARKTDYVLQKGTRFGAVVLEDVRFDYRGGYGDRYGDDRYRDDGYRYDQYGRGDGSYERDDRSRRDDDERYRDLRGGANGDQAFRVIDQHRNGGEDYYAANYEQGDRTRDRARQERERQERERAERDQREYRNPNYRYPEVQYNLDDKWSRSYIDLIRYDRRDSEWYGPKGALNNDLRWRGQILRFGNRELPFGIGRTLMVPLEEIARQVGLKTNRRGRDVTIGDLDRIMRLRVGEYDYDLGGRRNDLPVRLIERDGRIFLPVEALAPLLDRGLTINGMEVRPPS